MISGITSDNDHVKAAGERCECETSVVSVCMCCDNVTKNKKHKVCLTSCQVVFFQYLNIFTSTWFYSAQSFFIPKFQVDFCDKVRRAITVLARSKM